MESLGRRVYILNYFLDFFFLRYLLNKYYQSDVGTVVYQRSFTTEVYLT